MAMLGVSALFELLAVGGLEQLSLVEGARDDHVPILAGAVSGLAVLAFLVWFYRAYTNLPALGVRQPRFGPGWAIGEWFLPFVNLVRPKQIANDIWRASDPAVRELGHHWRQFTRRPVARVVNVWWALWLIGGIGQYLTYPLFRDNVLEGSSAEVVETMLRLSLAGSAVAAILIVRELTRRQELVRTVVEAEASLPERTGSA